MNIFSYFFVHVLWYQFDTWPIHLAGSATYRVSLTYGHSDLFYNLNWVKIMFLQLWQQQLHRVFRFGTYLYSKCLDPYWFSSWLGNFWPCDGRKQGDLSRAPRQRKVSCFFCTCFEIWTWNLVYTSGRWHQVWVSSQSGLLTHFTTNMGRIRFFYTWPNQLYESSKLGTYTYKASLLTLIDFCYSRAIFGLGGLRHRRVFQTFL